MSWVPGTLLGAVIATVLSAFTGPVVAESKLGNGMKCESSSDCRSSNCDEGRCKGRGGEKLDNGAACESSSDCRSSNCDEGRCKGRGGEKLDNGAACESSSDCKSSNCDEGRCKGH